MGAGIVTEGQAVPRLVLSLDGVVLREVNLTKDRTRCQRGPQPARRIGRGAAFNFARSSLTSAG